MEAKVQVNMGEEANAQATLDAGAQAAQGKVDKASQTAKATIDKTAQTAKDAVDQVADTAKESRPMVSNAAGKLVLASIGAVGLTSDALTKLMHRMVERGEMSKDDAQRVMRKLDSRRPHLRIRARGGSPAEASVDVDDVSTKSDVAALQAQIAALSAKLDMLTADKLDAPKPTLPKTTIK